jgi:hypothetical protein
MPSVLTKKQVKTYGPRFYTEGKRQYRITAKVRYDDECNNGHNTFAITADIDVKSGSGWREDAGGCCHDEVAKHFPELAPFIKWHLVSSDQPLHYIANTVYHAGDRDHWGLRKGEFKQTINRKTGQPCWELEYVPHEIKHIDAAEVPAPVVLYYVPSGITGEGKERDLNAARSSAVWPEATDEELTAPGLKERLEARHAALMADFQAAVESLGFVY